MSEHMTLRFIVAMMFASGPLLSIGACGSDGSLSPTEDDVAPDDAAAAVDASTVDDAALDAASQDASKRDARADAIAPDAAKTLNRCGGYSALELDGNPVNPGDSCGTCNDGTIACVGSNVVECAGASSPPCPTPPFDAGPNACGGYGPLTFLSADASVGDFCGGCGQLQCASTTSLVCSGFNYYNCTDAGPAPTCTIPSSAYTATTASPTLTAETRPSVTVTSSIALPAADLAYNPYDGFLYASVSGYVTQGNSIVRIDPVSATVLGSIYVGPSPTRIALSDDGNTLWVVVSGAPSIRRVDLTTFTAGATLTLPPYTNVTDTTVLAGTEDSLAVTAYYYSPVYGYTSYSTAIYDNGIPRAYAAPILQSTIDVSTASASLLFMTGGYYPYSIDALCIDGDGAFAGGSTIPSTYSTAPVFSNGVLYESDGSVRDALSGTLLHTFPVNIDSYPQVAVDAADVYFLTSTFEGSADGYWVQVTGFDRTTYASTITDLLMTNAGGTESFTRWGRYGFAYINGFQTIEIARSTIIPDMP